MKKHNQLRYDAQQTLDTLDKSGLSDDPFPLVFLKEQRDVANRFDVVLKSVQSSFLRDLRSVDYHA